MLTAPAVPALAPRVLSEPLGGGALARLALSGDAPDGWFAPVPRDPAGWRAHAATVARPGDLAWLARLQPALGRERTLAAERLARVARDGGVVVTTGQQPGLFGGPVYTWSKALSALAFADALEAAIGVPVAPVFWAATDDADLAEASETWIAVPGGAEPLRMHATAPEGTPMALVPLPTVDDELARLARGAGSVANAPVLELARRAYGGGTVGGAYVALLRGILEPLGIAVLDSAHEAVRGAAEPLLRQALAGGREVAAALAARDAAVRAAGHEPQVAQVEGRTLVFAWEDGVRRRLALGEAAPAGAATLSANVLLRPVVERAILPTVAYHAGPGELAYFAQVTAVADALRCARPLAVPRWSGTIVEPQVARILERHGLDRAELAAPHAAERRLARAAMPPALAEALRAWSEGARAGADRVARADDGLVGERVLEGAAAWMKHRVERVERRALAAIARREHDTMRDVATARGALYPGGVRQERALNLLPLLARHGSALLEAMRQEARVHADALVGR